MFKTQKKKNILKQQNEKKQQQPKAALFKGYIYKQEMKPYYIHI